MKPSEGYRYHMPSQKSLEGDDVAIIFRISLHLLKGRRYLRRIISSTENPLPKASQDPIHFHHVYWKKLVTSDYNWLSMSYKAREYRFFCFFFELFTTDPDRRSMLPARDRTAVRNNACWQGFYWSDGELNELVFDTFESYVESGPAYLGFSDCDPLWWPVVFFRNNC